MIKIEKDYIVCSKCIHEQIENNRSEIRKLQRKFQERGKSIDDDKSEQLQRGISSHLIQIKNLQPCLQLTDSEYYNRMADIYSPRRIRVICRKCGKIFKGIRDVEN